MSPGDQPRDFAPESGGWVLFVGGPKDGTYVLLPPLRDEIRVKEFIPNYTARHRFIEHDERFDGGEITDHVYRLECLWYGRSKIKWWIMLLESARRREPDLPRILAAERRALARALPKIEPMPLPLAAGPLAPMGKGKLKVENGGVESKAPGLPPLPSLKFLYGIKIPNPWKNP